ncbi:MAG: hypothetical protein MK212_11800 [Saprospiraceae bacterium]|nr:hypothetical protein [Saprospiraceae bacterium]
MTILDDNNYGANNENSTLALIRKYWMIYHLIFMTTVTWGAEILHQVYGINFLPIDELLFQIWLGLICLNTILLVHFVGKKTWLVSVFSTILGLFTSGVIIGVIVEALELSSMSIQGTDYFIRHLFFHLIPMVVFGGFIYPFTKSKSKTKQ